MEIDKITFENLRTLGITKSFDDLDVNNDGKITKDDLLLAQDGKISSQIMQMLGRADDDAELVLDDERAMQKSGATNYCFDHINEKDFKNVLKNSTGTVYLILGNLGNCGHCSELEDAFKANKSLTSELKSVATCYNMNWYDNESYCWQLIPDAAGSQFPIIAKFVDGKFVGTVGKPAWSNNSTAEQVQKKWIQKMVSEAEKTAASGNDKNTSETNTNNTTTSTTSAAQKVSAKTDADIKKAVNDLLTKYPIGETTGSGYSLKNPEVAALKKAVEGGIISQLAKEGFSQSDIINIIAQAYPKAGIKNNDKGGFTVPRGSGADAKEFYNMFIEEMNKATSAEVLALQAEVKALNDQILANNAKLDVLKVTIETLKRELEALIEKAIEESEENCCGRTRQVFFCKR